MKLISGISLINDLSNLSLNLRYKINLSKEKIINDYIFDLF